MQGAEPGGRQGTCPSASTAISLHTALPFLAASWMKGFQSSLPWQLASPSRPLNGRRRDQSSSWHSPAAQEASVDTRTGCSPASAETPRGLVEEHVADPLLSLWQLPRTHKDPGEQTSWEPGSPASLSP